MRKRIIRLIGAGFFGALILFCTMPAMSAITPESGEYTVSNDVASPDPAPMQGLGSFVIYQNTVIYVANDSDIYGYNMETGNTLKVCSAAILAEEDTPIGGLFVSKEGFLFFHNNSKMLYYANLSGDWPAQRMAYDTLCSGTIAAVTQNPWTGTIWYISASDNRSYLYQLYTDMASSTREMQFERPHGGTQGPVIWQGPRALLCGEQANGTGYLHLLDPSYPGTSESQRVICADYLTLAGGVSGVARAWNNLVYAASGDGQTIYCLYWQDLIPVANSDRPLKSLVYDGAKLYASLAEADGTRKNAGDISFDSLEKTSVSEGLALQGDYETYYLGATDHTVAFDHPAVHDRLMYYPGANGNVYGFDLDTGVDLETGSDILLELNDSEGVSLDGVYPYHLVVSGDDKLYFLDYNEDPAVSIYEYDFEDNEDNLTSVIDGCEGIPAFLVGHPETSELYVASYEGGGDAFYFTEMVVGGNNVITPTLVMEFNRFHSGFNGPVIFTGSQTVLYGENTNTGGYLHELNLEKGTVTQDVLMWDSPIKALSYGPYNSVFMIDGVACGLYEIKNNQPISVAATLDGSSAALCYDGYSLLLMKMGLGKDWDGPGLYRVWEQPQFGILAEEACSEVDVSAKADVVVSTNNGKAGIGLQGGTDVVVEYLKALDDDYLNGLPSRPSLPLGAVDFRLALEDDIITGTVTVYFSQAVGEDAFWWKYDEAQGWYKYRNVTLSDDRKSMEIVFADGGEGDADGLQNGYILDPGGPGYSSDNDKNKVWGDFTEDCFISECSHFQTIQGCSILVLFSFFVLILAVLHNRKSSCR